MMLSSILLSGLAAFSLAEARAYKRPTDAVGAVYFISNEPSGNQVVASHVYSNGTISFAQAVSTGGVGAHGAGSTGTDPLFTQDSVVVSGKHLLVVNAGSNTLTAFSINPRDAADIRIVGRPVSSRGEFPVSIATNPRKPDQVCVLNGGAVNGVSCYVLTSRGLTPLPNTVRSLGLNHTTPENTAGSVGDILFSQDGKTLFATVKGITPAIGFIASWAVASDGALSKNFTAIPATLGGRPFSLTLIPGRDAILVADPVVGATTYDLSTKNVKQAVIAIPQQGGNCWSIRSPQTGSFFLTDPANAIVNEITIDKNLKGTLVKQYPLAPTSAPIDVAIGTVHDRDFLFVLSPNVTSIDVLSTGRKAGDGKHVQTYSLKGAAETVKLNGVNMQGMATYIHQ